MAHFILIDDNSGFVWGDAHADTAISACRMVDESIGTFDREYEEVARLNGKGGYHVYEAPSDFDMGSVGDGNGQDKDLIDFVAALPLVSTVAVHSGSEW